MKPRHTAGHFLLMEVYKWMKSDCAVTAAASWKRMKALNLTTICCATIVSTSIPFVVTTAGKPSGGRMPKTTEERLSAPVVSTIIIADVSLADASSMMTTPVGETITRTVQAAMMSWTLKSRSTHLSRNLCFMAMVRAFSALSLRSMPEVKRKKTHAKSRRLQTDTVNTSIANPTVAWMTALKLSRIRCRSDII